MMSCTRECTPPREGSAGFQIASVDRSGGGFRVDRRSVHVARLHRPQIHVQQDPDGGLLPVQAGMQRRIDAAGHRGARHMFERVQARHATMR